MSKLYVSWQASISEGKEAIEWDQLNITEEAFKELSVVEQEDLVQNYLDSLPERVHIVLDQIYLKGSKEE
jgi:hypothetical protein